MAGMYGLVNREVIRVKVKKCDGLVQPEYNKFSVDPQITSFEMLQNLLARAFNISSDFTVSYLAKGEAGQNTYLSMLSDWDMDAAFQTASDPYLKLKVDLRPFDDGLDDWDIIAPVDIPQHRFSTLIEKSSFLNSITGTISSQVERTVSQMQKVMRLKTDESIVYKPLKPPMTDSEFHHYMDSDGRLVRPEEFRLSIYQGGVEPALRPVVWRHMLNLFPENMTGRERFDYVKRKEREYYKLRDEWKNRFSNGNINEELRFVTSMVKKDVLRTDRTHKFYAGSDENKNVVSLFHILVTFAITHPQISYCQGMSDIASPLLVIEKDEAQAYLCFCGIMRRLRANFASDGIAITTKLQHLQDLLQLNDPVFFAYLNDCSAQDLFFCYRWLLLEVKREFPFEDALYMLEVMWSTLPPDPPDYDLPLADPEYSPVILSPSPISPNFTSKKSVYAKLLARRQSTTGKNQINKKLKPQKNVSKLLGDNSINNNCEVSQLDLSPGDEDKFIIGTIEDFPASEDSMTRSLRAKSTIIDMSLESGTKLERQNGFDITPEECSMSEITKCDCNEHEAENKVKPDLCNGNGPSCNDHSASIDEEALLESEDDVTKNVSKRRMSASLSRKRPEEIVIPKPVFSEVEMDVGTGPKVTGSTVPDVTVDRCPNGEDSLDGKDSSKHQLPVTLKENGQVQAVREGVGLHISDCIEASELMTPESPDQTSMEIIKVTEKILSLPQPEEFGCGNPFLMFVCLSLLLQHRDHIMRNHMDYDELAMHFDKMVRKHNVYKVLYQARSLYSDYLKDQQKQMLQDDGVEPNSDFSV
ncbi:TBC1 domain family member 25-like isoform X2 [Liolophura sinensis]|uniref:TBC1 domain family member 25-like isoform X2 n=1 Tax=Liolophura sinensis TaxID=3198878 RepID=UPI003158DEA0